MKRIFSLSYLALAALAVGLTASASHAQIYDAAADFSILNGNPNAAPSGATWTYGYTLGLGGSLVLFDSTSPGEAFAGTTVDVWRHSTFVNQGVPTVTKNVGTTTGVGQQPGQLALHPGQTNSYAVLRFTAPATSTYSLASQFFAGNTGDTSIDVYKNGVFGSPLFSSGSTNSNPTFNSSIALNVGDTLTFAVGPGSSFLSDTTPLNVKITAAPEPASLALLALGATFGGGILRRRRSAK